MSNPNSEFFFVEVVDSKGCLEHNFICSSLSELFYLSEGRNVKMTGVSSEAEYNSPENLEAVGID